jgi:serine/threonine-protein kinase RsbW
MMSKPEAPIQIALTGARDQKEVAAQIEAMQDWMVDAGCDPISAQQLAVVTDELLTNIVMYGQGSRYRAELQLVPQGQGFEAQLRLEDDGIAFDPTAAEEPGLPETLEEQPIGCFGIVFMRKMTDSQSYRRVDGNNILEIRKMCGFSNN